MAVYKFRAYYEDDDAVYRDVVIKHSQTFLDLHNVQKLSSEQWLVVQKNSSVQSWYTSWYISCTSFSCVRCGIAFQSIVGACSRYYCYTMRRFFNRKLVRSLDNHSYLHSTKLVLQIQFKKVA